MRKPLIIISVAVASLLAAITLVFWLGGGKEFLLGRLARAVGHPVRAAAVDLSFMPLALTAQEIEIGADRAQPILTAKSLRMEAGLLPLLLGQLRATTIVIETPVIYLERDRDGAYNFTPVRERNASGTKRGERPQREAGGWFIPPLRVSQGSLRYRDLNAEQELTASAIELTISADDADQPVEIEISAALLSAATNLKLKGRIGPMAGIRDYRDYPLDGRLDAEQIDFARLNQALPRLRKALPKHLRFDGIYDIKELSFKGSLNRPRLKGAVKGTDASFRFE